MHSHHTNSTAQQQGDTTQRQEANSRNVLQQAANDQQATAQTSIFDTLSYPEKRLALEFIHHQWGMLDGDFRTPEVIECALKGLQQFNAELVEKRRSADYRRWRRALHSSHYNQGSFEFISEAAMKADPDNYGEDFFANGGWDEMNTIAFGPARNSRTGFSCMGLNARPVMYGPFVPSQVVHAVARHDQGRIFRLDIPDEVIWVDRGHVVAFGYPTAILNHQPIEASFGAIVELEVSCTLLHRPDRRKIPAQVESTWRDLISSAAWKVGSKPPKGYVDMEDGRPLNVLPPVLEVAQRESNDDDFDCEDEVAEQDYQSFFHFDLQWQSNIDYLRQRGGSKAKNTTAIERISI